MNKLLNFAKKHPIISIFVVLILIGMLFSPKDQSNQEEKNISVNSQSEVTSLPTKKDNEVSNPTAVSSAMRIVRIEQANGTGTPQNLYVLVETSSSNEESLKTKAQQAVDEVKKNRCNRKCNISLYDDDKALKLQKEYDENFGKQADPSYYENWKKNNYIYVADHYLGYKIFDSDEVVIYPMKDWYYKEQKGE